MSVKNKILFAIGLAVASCAVAGGSAVAQTPSQPPAWPVPNDPAKDNWRATTVLDSQRDATGGAHPMSGAEQEIILDNYRKSIGKGGSGAPLPPSDNSSGK